MTTTNLQPPPMPRKSKIQENVPERFRTAKATLAVDRFMNQFIKIGGISVIGAVLGIFLFILMQVIPLFGDARVEPLKTLNMSSLTSHIHHFGVDEWGELPFIVDDQYRVHFISYHSGDVVRSEPLQIEGDKTISISRYSMREQKIYMGTTDGFFALAKINYEPVFDRDKRTIVGDVSTEAPLEIFAGHPIVNLDYADAESQKLVAAIQKVGDSYQLRAVTLVQEQTLFGAGETSVDEVYNLSGFLKSDPKELFVNSQADSIIVSTEEGEIYFFFLGNGEPELRQVFKPFADQSSPTISLIQPLFGDVSLVLANPEGFNRIFSLYIPEGKQKRFYGQINEFPALPGPATFSHRSIRNKAFILGAEKYVSLRYATTGKVRWEKEFDQPIRQALIGGKYKKVFFLDDANQLHINKLDDEHPEAGWKAFFKKLWYEGYTKPSYSWQSTGGTDDFEPKLSLAPLIFGTLKGTFYALLFALPIALLAALYTSQFAHPKFKIFIKPTMEIMASLPSVVLGFLAALWLAPIIEDRVPSLITIICLMPLSALAIGWLWANASTDIRLLVKQGYEWLVYIPILLGVVYFGWHAGLFVESWFFCVTDPDTGEKIASFKLWWQTTVGASFEQRNSLVVGFIMGFAVIPIIFTIAEDALSNVPQTLKAASLALGASRWQTAFRVILPTAFPGIFSAAMIGFGRAVGETMIVVMATGNTPIMEWNIFNGFRTLSANIAVELPEAPYLGTLYRTLFLGALVLFVMTFIINSIAEVIRQHLREKYKTV